MTTRVIVVDASVLAPALADDGPDGERTRARLSGTDLAAPALIDLEVTSLFRGLVRSGQLTDHRAARALADLMAIPIERTPHTALLSRIWLLRDNLTAYDAAYVALAEIMSVPLVTADAKLAKAANQRCTVELMSSG
ncbi:MAG: type II toxin-antitoxin system VapC family toxin [Micromonosporaceae bacterium]